MTTALLRAGDVVVGERGRAYRILEWRAEGSFSRVYRATDLFPSQILYAVKLAKPEVPGAAARLERERIVRTRVRHPRLGEIFDAGRQEDAPFLVLGWIDGSDLRSLTERPRRLPLVTALGYLQDVAGAAAALHAGGFAHGDIRPGNILVRRSDHCALLTDLGETVERRDPDFAARLADDLRALGYLLARMLTGERSDRWFECLTTENGYNPAAVGLCREASAGRLPAAAVERETVRLLRAIGAARRR